MRAIILTTAAAALLGACATPAERAAKLQQEMDRMMVVYGPACQKLGYAAQSDAWRNCVLQLSMKDELSSSAAYGAYYYPPYRHWGPYRPYGW